MPSWRMKMHLWFQNYSESGHSAACWCVSSPGPALSLDPAAKYSWKMLTDKRAKVFP